MLISENTHDIIINIERTDTMKKYDLPKHPNVEEIIGYKIEKTEEEIQKDLARQGKLEELGIIGVLDGNDPDEIKQLKIKAYGLIIEDKEVPQNITDTLKDYLINHSTN